MYGPLLSGSKVTLRPPDEGDAARFVEWFADLEVTRYLGRRTVPALFQEEEFLKHVGESKNDVFWMIETEGRAIGASGIHQIDWMNAHATTGTVIGDRSMWRKGFGTESMALRTTYAFDQLNLHKLMTQVFMENEPSKRGLQKSGYREIGIEREHFFREGRWHDHWLAELLRSDWERQRSGDRGAAILPGPDQ